MQENPQWHLNKGVSLSIIAALLLQCLTFGWYAARISFQVEQDHLAIVGLETWKEKQDRESSMLDSHLAVVDEKLIEQGLLLHRIDDFIEQPYRKK